MITHTSPSEEYEKLVRRWIMIESDGQKDRQVGANRHKNIVKKTDINRDRRTHTQTPREKERERERKTKSKRD